MKHTTGQPTAQESSPISLHRLQARDANSILFLTAIYAKGVAFAEKYKQHFKNIR